jgi:hypothetical protein
LGIPCEKKNLSKEKKDYKVMERNYTITFVDKQRRICFGDEGRGR